MKTKLLIALLLTTVSAPAMADIINMNQCYPAPAMFYYVTRKISKNAFELRGANVPSNFRQAIYQTQRKIKGTGQLGGQIKLIGTQDVELQNGFTESLPVFTDCE